MRKGEEEEEEAPFFLSISLVRRVLNEFCLPIDSIFELVEAFFDRLPDIRKILREWIFFTIPRALSYAFFKCIFVDTLSSYRWFHYLSSRSILISLPLERTFLVFFNLIPLYLCLASFNARFKLLVTRDK